MQGVGPEQNPREGTTETGLVIFIHKYHYCMNIKQY